MSNVLQYRFGKKQKRESFFKLSSLLNSLKTVVTVQRCVKMKRFVSFFQSFTDFYFLVHQNIIIFVTVACLMTSSPLIMGYRSCFWEDINDDQESWMNLKNFITKCDGIITNFDSLVHLIQIAMDSSQIATRFMANSDRCYKVRWWLLILTVQGVV